jgi:hypothetical protein
MTTGLLWFDDRPNVSVKAKIEQAARRYRERCGRDPSVCYVHPRTLVDASELAIELELAGKQTVQPNHFWIGVRSP